MRAWLKGLTVLIIILNPLLSDSSFLTAQDTTNKPIKLVCQAPPRDTTTGKLIDASNPIFRDTFSPREEDRVEAKPICDCETEESNGLGIWVRLESISFNHTPESGYYDAIDIRQNWQECVRVPEWKKDKDPYPAAYIKKRNVTIRAVFSASTNLDSIYIGACRCSGELGDVIEKEVNFRKRCIFKNSKIGSEHFQINLPTPDRVISFDQEWRWYFIYEGVRHYISKSKNKIYIILAQPQSPWKTKGRSKPWAEALDLTCTWADGESTPEGAASKITHQLYHSVDASYDRYGYKQYIQGPENGGIFLGEFLRYITDIDKVNCAVMGKALVSFANLLGCGANYREIRPKNNHHGFFKLNCIEPVGRNCCDVRSSIFHAFASIGDLIFDPTFYYTCERDCRDRSYSHVHIMANIPWEEYKIRLIKEQITNYPETFRFNIVCEK